MDVLISQESDASLDLDSVPLPSFSRLGQTPAALHLQPQPGRSTLRGFNATIHTLVSALEELSSTLNLDSTFGSSSSSSSSGPSRPAINPSWPLKAATPSPTMSPVLPHPVSHLAVAIPGAATRGEAATADPMKRASIPPTPLSPVTATSRASMAPGSTSDSAQQEFGALVAKRKRSSISWPGGEDVGSLPGSGRGEEQFKSRRLAAGLSSRFSRSVNVEDEGGGGTEGTPFGWGPVLDGDRAGSSSAWRHVARPRERVHETGSGPFGRQGNAGGPGEVLMLGEQAQAEDAMMDEDHEAISPAETDDDASGHIDLSGPNGARGWDMKRLELEHNCMLLQNGVFPRDSYDDMRLITERILDCARTLAGGPDFCTLDAIVPAWRSVKPTVERVWHFIQVTEDMKALAASNWQMDPNGLDDSLKGMRALLEEKSRLYGDALGLNGLPWKMLGFPVDEQLLDSVSLWMLALPWRYLLLIDTTLSSGKESFGVRDIAPYHTFL
ncbi:hypothetical protein HK101_000192 [Irineochytrium annulatum]|nr:hypothetical protein HK101_000192 [Irineochytrium annulatum]